MMEKKGSKGSSKVIPLVKAQSKILTKQRRHLRSLGWSRDEIDTHIKQQESQSPHEKDSKRSPKGSPREVKPRPLAKAPAPISDTSPEQSREAKNSNGNFTMINNELLAALMRKETALPMNARMIFDFIIRQTSGYGRKDTNPKHSRLKDFCNATGMKKGHVSRELKRLMEANMVTYIGNQNGRSYRIQADIQKWKRLPKQVTLYKRLPKQVTKGYLSRQQKVTQVGNRTRGKHKSSKASPPPKRKEKTIKEKPLVASQEALQLSKLLFELMTKNNPDVKPPNLQSWARDMDEILRIDGRNLETVRQVIDWCQSDDFWMTNILSPRKLRKQFDGLKIKMDKANNARPGLHREDERYKSYAGFGPNACSSVDIAVYGQPMDWNSDEVAKPETVANGVKQIVENCGNGQAENRPALAKEDFTGMGDPNLTKLVGKDAAEFEEKRAKLKEQAKKLNR